VESFRVNKYLHISLNKIPQKNISQHDLLAMKTGNKNVSQSMKSQYEDEFIIVGNLENPDELKSNIKSIFILLKFSNTGFKNEKSNIYKQRGQFYNQARQIVVSIEINY
jgi:hypothetical protein